MHESNFVKTVRDFLYKHSLLVILTTLYVGVYVYKL
jgi:hypothetical protein